MGWEVEWEVGKRKLPNKEILLALLKFTCLYMWHSACRHARCLPYACDMADIHSVCTLTLLLPICVQAMQGPSSQAEREELKTRYFLGRAPKTARRVARP